VEGTKSTKKRIQRNRGVFSSPQNSRGDDITRAGGCQRKLKGKKIVQSRKKKKKNTGLRQNRRIVRKLAGGRPSNLALPEYKRGSICGGNKRNDRGVRCARKPRGQVSEEEKTLTQGPRNGSSRGDKTHNKHKKAKQRGKIKRAKLLRGQDAKGVRKTQKKNSPFCKEGGMGVLGKKKRRGPPIPWGTRASTRKKIHQTQSLGAFGVPDSTL